jgi:hypothetical protein
VPETCSGRNRKPIVPAVGGLFFPQSKSLGIDRSHFSPALQAKIVYAGSNHTSYSQAEQALRVLAEIDVSDKQARRLCKTIGAQRVAERDAEVAAYLDKPLTERKAAPPGVTAPDLAVVGVDGGRLQIFERGAAPGSSPVAAEVIEDDVAMPEPLTATPRPRHWREDKIGLLLTMTSKAYATDPCPEIPESFINPQWIAQLAKELGCQGAAKQERGESAPTSNESVAVVTARPAWQTPEVATKNLVATRRPWDAFGPMVAESAWSLGFYGAARKAFLGDGAECNWTLWRNHFSSFTPILDFIHALTYVYHSAMAGKPQQQGWQSYTSWIGWVWGGEVEKVIEALRQRQGELGVATPDAKETHPAKVVERALGYLQHHQGRMRYADYRRQGLPIVSSYVESAVKQFNYRVKGTEKFWREEGAEEILQLRADFLSDMEPMDAFWQRRQAAQTGQVHYGMAV